MGLIAQARADINSIRTNTNDFGVTIILSANTSPVTTKTIAGTYRHINLQFDELGMVKANASTASCTITEAALIAASYPYKDSNGNINFERHRATIVDNSTTRSYVVDEWTPNYNLGEIILQLGYIE